MPLISCENLTLSYEDKVVLSDLTFDINKGDYLCIVGENGSGKSTLIKALLSLKEPIKGCITFEDTLDKKKIGYLPQQTMLQKDFPASVFEVVLSGCLNSKGFLPFYTQKDYETADFNMERLMISHLKKSSCRELSGGQLQRVFLARALCSTQKILLLDEPVSGLDPIVTEEFYALIKELNKQGITIVMVSHDINSAVKYSSHILHLRNKPLFFGTTDDYVRSGIGIRFLKEEYHD